MLKRGQVFKAPHQAVFVVLEVGKRVRVLSETGVPMYVKREVIEKWRRI